MLNQHGESNPITEFSPQPAPPQRINPQPHHHGPTPIQPLLPPPRTGTSQEPSGKGRHHHYNQYTSFLRGPTSRQTTPTEWLVAALCALFWIIVIVGGLILLIVYLVFQPRLPTFNISAATLNAAYLDMGHLLNADITLLANFTNPNTKVDVDFGYVVLDAYYERNIVVTRYVSPFPLRKKETRFADVHMVASQVRLSTGLSLELQRMMDNGTVRFEIRGVFRTRSRLGEFFRYSYWLYAHCEVELASPPTGVLISRTCVTRR